MKDIADKANGRQAKSGPPAHVEKQRTFVLRLLREAGTDGVNKIDFVDGTGPCRGRRVTQPQARLDELTKQGYKFESRQISGKQFVQLYLIEEPLLPHPQPEPWQRPATAEKKPAASAEQMTLLAATGTSDEGERFLQFESGRKF